MAHGVVSHQGCTIILDGTCEGAAAAALNFATAVASEVDESQFLAAADNNTLHHSGRKRFPHSKGRLIDADWKHRVAVGLLRDRKDATGKPSHKTGGRGRQGDATGSGLGDGGGAGVSAAMFCGLHGYASRLERRKTWFPC